VKILAVKVEFYFLENFVLDRTVILNFTKIRAVKPQFSSKAENEFVLIFSKFWGTRWRS